MELITLTGRTIKGFNTNSNIKTGSCNKVARFIVKEAIKEAKLNNDKLNELRFSSEDLRKIPNAVLDAANIYLFGSTDYFN